MLYVLYTRQVYEKALGEQLEQGLRLAMRESLEEVTAEMAKQERPSMEVIFIIVIIIN